MSTIVALAFLLLPFPVLLLRFAWRGRNAARFLVFWGACLLGYGFLLLSVDFRRDELVAAVDSFDRDHNGLIGGEENSAEARAAIIDATNDTGLNLAPITGVPATLIWYGLVFLLGEWMLARMFLPSTKRNPA